MVRNLTEVSPPGWEATVKAMKKHKEIRNPWALAWWMRKQGYQPRKGKKGKKRKESLDIDDGAIRDAVRELLGEQALADVGIEDLKGVLRACLTLEDTGRGIWSRLVRLVRDLGSWLEGFDSVMGLADEMERRDVVDLVGQLEDEVRKGLERVGEVERRLRRALDGFRSGLKGLASR